jgi:tetratricopeptide (TPR) repeat protein
LAVAAPAGAARKEMLASPGLTYLEARAAEMDGDHARSAALFATLAEQSRDETLTKRALGTAIEAGEADLALRLARALPAADLPIQGKLLLVADELRQGRNAQAIAVAGEGEIASAAFLVPLIRAWDAAGRRDSAAALAALDSAPPNGLFAPFRDEHRALILLKLKQPAAAEPLAARALAAAGGRRGRLRMVFADAFLKAGDRKRAQAMITSADDPLTIARVRSGKRLGQKIDSAASAASELLTGLALDLSRSDKGLAVAVLHVARHADPANSGAALLQGLVLDLEDRDDAALAAFRSLGPKDALAPQARNYEARLLTSRDRFQEALALALPLAQRRDAGIADHQRLAGVYSGMKRYGEAADSFGRAIALGVRQGLGAALWPLYYERASVLEQADRWAEAKSDLNRALALAPDQPALLNFLGYAKLERGEDLDLAEAMIRKASALAPDEAAITDSLGWALFKRGRLPEAIETLQRAAAKEAQEPEIHEHLGDALYSAGRKYEARFAWNAALNGAEEAVAKRIRAKIESGLTPETAAP